MFGIAFKLVQDGIGMLPIIAAVLGGTGSFLLGVVNLLREYRAWKAMQSRKETVPAEEPAKPAS